MPVKIICLNKAGLDNAMQICYKEYYVHYFTFMCMLFSLNLQNYYS